MKAKPKCVEMNMMNFKRELQMNKLALAALLLGVFSLNPIARAEEPAKAAEAPKVAEAELPAAEEEILPESKRDGLKWGELRTLSGNSFNFRVDGDMLVFTGSIPKGCASGRTMSEVSSGAGVHSLSINFPNCPQGDISKLSAENKKPVQVKAAFPAKSFNANENGKFCLSYSSNGDGEAGCDPIILADSKQLEHRSLASIASEKLKLEQDAATKASSKEHKQKEDDLARKVGLLCKQGDFAGISLELEAASAWLGDITSILDQIGKAKMKKAESGLKKAKTPEELKEAYEVLLAEGFDSEKGLELYVERRLSMGKDLLASKSISDIESGINELESDLNEAGVFEENKAAISWLFVEVGNRLREEKDYDGAESQYNKAMQTADLKGKVKIEQEMAKMFLAAAEACQDENKLKLAKCDALAKKAEKHAANMIAQQGRVRGDDALEELNSMKAEKIQQFGLPVVNIRVQGYGVYNPYGGAFAQRKQQMYQTGMQELYMQRMMQQQVGGQPGMSNGNAGSFLR